MVTPAESNALRAVAKQCNEELHSAIKAKFDNISRPIIMKHAARVKPHFSLIQLIHAVGVLNGQYPDR